MGRVKKSTISLGVFYLKYFGYIFLFLLLGGIGVLLLFHGMVNKGIIYPANYNEEQVNAAYKSIQSADKVTDDLIPKQCEYVVFDGNGNQKSTSLREDMSAEIWNAMRHGVRRVGGYYYTVIPRETETCVVLYTLYPRYQSPFLCKYFVNPQILLLLIAVLGTFGVIAGVAIRFGKALNKRLATLVLVTNKVENRELDFEISASGIREIDAVLKSMDHMRRALKESLEQQWLSEQEKNYQMSALAHDLKTPLTLVRGNAELLLESELTEEQRKYVEYIEISSQQMHSYVQTLIEVTKSWQNDFFHPKKVVWNSLFLEISQQVNGLCMLNKLTPILNGTNSHKEILVDHDSFLRAVVNVVSNAVEHTPEGGTVEVAMEEEKGGFLLVVQDSGSGFSEEDLRRGTEPFYMGDRSRNSKTHHGIGLYVADVIIQRHGGRMILENRGEASGAKVSIWIPINEMCEESRKSFDV